MKNGFESQMEVKKVLVVYSCFILSWLCLTGNICYDNHIRQHRRLLNCENHVKSQDVSDITGFDFRTFGLIRRRCHYGLSKRTRRSFLKSRISLYSKTTSLITYQLKKDSTIKAQILCGDIELNAGPVKNPCSVCHKPVAVTHRALKCDACKLRCHIGKKCANFPVAEYRIIVDRKTAVNWQCPPCLRNLGPTPPLSQQQQQQQQQQILANEGERISHEHAEDTSPYDEVNNELSFGKNNLKIAHINCNSLLGKLVEIKCCFRTAS